MKRLTLSILILAMATSAGAWGQSSGDPQSGQSNPPQDNSSSTQSGTQSTTNSTQGQNTQDQTSAPATNPQDNTAGSSSINSSNQVNPESDQTNQSPGTNATQTEPMDQTPVFRVNVVSRTTPAVNYHFRSGATKVDLMGTELMPNAKGSAK